MHPTIRSRARRCAAVAAPAVIALALLAGCGSSGDSAGDASAAAQTVAAHAADPAIVAKLPADYRNRKTLVIATDATYPPDEFIASDGTTVIGMDADLGKAIAEVMGMRGEVVNAIFDTILPGIDAGKYDLGMSSYTDTKEREQSFDFVTYVSAGTGFYVQASGGPAIDTLADLCGHKVAVEKATTQQTDVETQSRKCTAAGKPGAQALVFPDQNSANLALSSGRADVGMADSPVVDYSVKQSRGQLKRTGEVYGTAPYGIALARGNGLAPAVLAAVKKLMADGTYRRILARWGLSAGAIDNPQINAARG